MSFRKVVKRDAKSFFRWALGLFEFRYERRLRTPVQRSPTCSVPCSLFVSHVLAASSSVSKAEDRDGVPVY